MAQFTFFQSVIPGHARARMIVESTTGEPVRVDVQGRTGSYKLVIRRNDRTKEVLFDFDSDTLVSKFFPPDVGSVFVDAWEFGIFSV